MRHPPQVVCCNADFWPAEMHEVQDEIFHRMEEEAEAEADAADAWSATRRGLCVGGVGNFSSDWPFTNAERPI